MIRHAMFSNLSATTPIVSIVTKSLLGVFFFLAAASPRAEINVWFSIGPNVKVTSYSCSDKDNSNHVPCPDYVHIRQEIGGPTLRAFGSDNFAEIERIYASIKDGKAKFDDGTWKLTALETSLTSIIGTKESHRDSFTKIKQWKNAFPASALAQFSEAIHWRNRAWSVRSSSLTASREELQIFNDRMDTSLGILLAIKNQGNDLALVYPSLIKFAIERNSDPKVIYDHFQSAQKELPTLHAIYLAYATSLFPKYKKTNLDFDAFARFATALPNQPDGHGLYARLLLSADDHDIYPITFSEIDSKSSDVLRSLKTLTILHPNSELLLNQYAHLLCRTNDTESFLDVMKRLSFNKHIATFSVVSMEACVNRHKPKLGTGI